MVPSEETSVTRAVSARSGNQDRRREESRRKELGGLEKKAVDERWWVTI
jgi:hypothetical protein